MSAKKFISCTGAPVADNTNSLTAGPRGPILLQDIWLIEKLAHFDRELIPERRMHANSWGAYETFTITREWIDTLDGSVNADVRAQVRISLAAGLPGRPLRGCSALGSQPHNASLPHEEAWD